MRPLDVEHLRRFSEYLHDQTGEWFPHPVTVPDECWGCLDSILHSVQGRVFGHRRYSDLWAIATALLVRIARRHCLPNGNKRLASAAFLATLIFNLDVFYPGLDSAAAEARVLHAEHSLIKAIAVLAARTSSSDEDALITDLAPVVRRAMNLEPLLDQGGPR